ncbi:MAG: hypothetical protein HFF36_06280 [Coprobacillus sp.]|nr:hypothetical protein [Coprobacillus sp.]
MKILLYSDENIYQKLHNYYLEIDENDMIIRNEFDRNSSDIFHINDISYINYAINPIDGFRNVTDVIIQKSMIKNKKLMRILFKFKYINPNAHIILFMDDDPIYYEVLLSRIAQFNLCHVVNNVEEFDELLSNDYQQDLTHHILKKEKRSLLKEYARY